MDELKKELKEMKPLSDEELASVSGGATFCVGFGFGDKCTFHGEMDGNSCY